MVTFGSGFDGGSGFDALTGDGDGGDGRDAGGAGDVGDGVQKLSSS